MAAVIISFSRVTFASRALEILQLHMGKYTEVDCCVVQLTFSSLQDLTLIPPRVPREDSQSRHTTLQFSVSPWLVPDDSLHQTPPRD